MPRRLWAIDLQTHRHAEAGTLGKLRYDTQGCLYIADPGDGVVHKFDDQGNLLLRFASPRSENLQCPQDVAIDRHGDLFVADPVLQRIARFDRDGHWKGSFATEVRPLRIAIDRNDVLYVHAPAADGVLHRYNIQGNRLASFGPGPGVGRAGTRQAAGDTRRTEYPVYLNDTGSMVMDSRDRLYFAARGTYSVHRFSRAGRVVRSFRRRVREKPVSVLVNGTEGVAWTVVILDIAVSLDTRRIYVLRGHLRNKQSLVDVWSDAGEYEKQISFDHPGASIACDDSGNMYLLFTNAARGIATLVKYAL